MARFTTRSQPWDLNVEQEWIDTTSDVDTLDPKWRGTDSNGHEHFYDQQVYEYPTLDYIVDAEHWCDGTEGVYNHDPHMAVDKSHYECKLCREVVKPGVIPGGTPTGIPGVRKATLTGLTSGGLKVTLALVEADFEAIKAADGTVDPEDPAPTERDLVVRRILDDAIERWRGRESAGSRVLVVEQTWT